MKITAVEAIPIHAPMRPGDVYWGNQTWGKNKDAKVAAAGLPPDEDRAEYPHLWRSRAAYSRTVDTTLVKITTDAGIVGWGEAKSPVAPEVTATIIRELLAGILIGQDPLAPAFQWDRMYGAMRIRGHAQGFWIEAISGVDIALWDVLGKALGQPVCKLLGGAFRQRVKVYASGIPGVRHGAPQQAWDNLRVAAEDVKQRGFRAVKVAIGLSTPGDIRTVEILRDAFGPEFTIFTDAAMMYDVPQAIEVGRALEKLNAGWLEAPLPSEDIEGYARLARALDLPIASDLIFNRWQVRNMLVAGGLDVVQPDVCRSGGITECKRIAELADAFHKAATPHVSIGSIIQFAASAHLAASLPNQAVMEFWFGANPIGDAIAAAPLRLVDGYLHVPMGPGLGIDIDEDKVRQYAVSL